MERRLIVTISGEYGSVELDVFDYSFNGTFTITCGLYEITTATADVYVFIFSEENPDLDGDGFPDEFDRCPESSIAFNSDSPNESTVTVVTIRLKTLMMMTMGGRILPTVWSGFDWLGLLQSSLDHDGEGCQDESEDLDDDDDTIPDLG
ncbi:MAG: hypothetical protein Ct9H90mP16_21580 [Candidatus Poseidoniales archaeon]|nr:MAG: hypothetical protein Ct9H90mP16_21580 [Candidatus Poseidoniales archaeon]